MPKRTQSFDSWRQSKLADPDTAAAYLSAAMTDSTEMFRKALRNVAQARQMTKVAREAGVTRESLYRATSNIGNPTLETLRPVLAAVGITMKFEATETPSASPAPITGVLSSPHASTPPRERSGYRSQFRTGGQSTFKVLDSGVTPLAPSVQYDANVCTLINLPTAAQPLPRGNYQLWLQETQPHQTPRLSQALTTDEQMTFCRVMPTMSNLSQACGI